MHLQRPRRSTSVTLGSKVAGSETADIDADGEGCAHGIQRSLPSLHCLTVFYSQSISAVILYLRWVRRLLSHTRGPNFLRIIQQLSAMKLCQIIRRTQGTTLWTRVTTIHIAS